MSVDIRQIINANLYVDGTSFIGRVQEIELPNVQWKTAEFAAIGMIGTPEFVAGLEKMEGRIKWQSMSAEAASIMFNPFQAREMIVRASVEVFQAQGRTAEVPLNVFVTASVKNAPLGNFKRQENAEFESNLAITYVKVELDGVELLEIDVLNNVYRVDGVDQLANYRANLGIA